MAFKSFKPSKIDIEENVIKVYSNNSNDIFVFDYSEELFNKLKDKAWSITRHGKYLRTRIEGKDIYAYQLVIPPKAGYEIDHIDKNTKNNRKNNLRYATRSQNLSNKRNVKHSSKYRGVSWDKATRKWRSQIKIKNKSKCLGRYSSEALAANAYDEEAQKAFGEYANLNFKGGYSYGNMD